MIVKTIGSGSSGNGYALISGEDILLLECGVPAKEMLKAIDYQTSMVNGCILSHIHGDHAGYIKQYIQYGIMVYTSDEVETDVETVIECINEIKPDIVIIDSIQTMNRQDIASAAGSVPQVREATNAFMHIAKSLGISMFIVGHVTKEGAIAGPRVLEHMVDCVLYFEGEQAMGYRILRAAKNRFGSTNEIGVFEMDEEGLREVPNPSEMLLSGRPLNAPGTCVACAMEGTRPVLAEVQVLVSRTSFNVPRRTSNGFDFNRANLLLAVTEKRGGLNISMCDAYVNVIGGLYLDEPAADLALVLAVASSHRDTPIDPKTLAIGEVGLTGEVRAVTSMQQRLTEAARLGFTRCIVPRHSTKQLQVPDGLELIRVRNIREAIEMAL